MDTITPRLLKGFRDFAPNKQTMRLFCIDSLQKVFRLYGFMPIDTPILEYDDILLGKGGGETDKQVYRFEDQGKRNVAMRFDLTVPFARYVAMNRHTMPLPFYRSQIGKVFRGENTQRGRYREFVQCDFDIIGMDYASLDFTILQTIIACFSALSLPKVKVHISHRGLLNEFLASRQPIAKPAIQSGAQNNAQDDWQAGEQVSEQASNKTAPLNGFAKNLSKEQAIVETLRIIDKIRKVGSQKVRELLERLWDSSTASQIIKFGTREATNEKTMHKLASFLELQEDGENSAEYAGHRSQSKSFARLQEIIAMVDELDIAAQVVVDPSITRGLDYYTGFVCETFVEDYEEVGSVCSGGRYNNLTQLFSDEPSPGVGASIGLDRLLSIMEDAASDFVGLRMPTIAIFPQTESVISYCHVLVAQLQDGSNSVQVYPVAGTLKQFFKYAEKIEADFVCIVGTDELESGTITIKHQRTREQLSKTSLAQAREWMQNYYSSRVAINL